MKDGGARKTERMGLTEQIEKQNLGVGGEGEREKEEPEIKKNILYLFI